MPPKKRFTDAVVLVLIYSYLYITRDGLGIDSDLTVCLFKRFMHLPCPGCGTIRATRLLFQGDFVGSLLMNPLGIIIFMASVIYMVLFLKDLLLKTSTLENFMHHPIKVGQILTIIILVAMNWVWNIYKGI